MSIFKETTKEQTLPMLILRQSVAFPSIPFRLEVDDDKSLYAVHEASDGGCLFIVSANTENYPTSKRDLMPVGVIAKIKSVETGDNQLGIWVTFECLCRAELIRATFGKVDTARVIGKTILPSPDDPEVEELKKEILDLYDHFLTCVPGYNKELADVIHKVENPGQLADCVAASVFIRNDHKQEILNEFDPIARMKKVIYLFKSEIPLLENEMNVHKRTRAHMEEHQRDYYLREQLKVIKEELGEYEDEDDSYFLAKQIADSGMPEEAKERLLKEVKKLSKLPFASPESNVVRSYIETCLELPWGKKTQDRTDLEAAKKILEKDHDGMQDIKERVLEFIAVRKLSNGNKNQIICLVGAPGVGKTSVASSIAKALKRKYVRVSLGGVRDEADIRGHRKTYIGAMPGRIMTALSDAGTDNPLILLDEIDKLTRDAHGDPSAALLEVLDPDQNISFRDHFIEIPYDLSDCLFIATANTLETIPKPLLDRMEVIEMKSYTRAEKLSIAKNHLLGKQLEKHGMNRRMVKIDDQAMLEIIDHYTREAGVRGLEREIAAICRKVAKKMVENPDKKSYKITKEDLFSYLGPQKVMDETLSPCDEVGVVNGLAYTEAGGDLLKVEAVSFGGTGKLELTGSLGDVMVESAKIALSVVRSRAKEWEISPDFYKNTDIHIHFPEGAVPKDGPSAGVTMVTALISELSGRPVRRDIAMTGEVTLHGKVLAIGGLREKTMAAYQAGIQTVFIPNENRQDYDRLDDFIKEGMNFVFCRTVDDVLSQALSDRQIELEKEKKISTVSPVYLSERNTSDSEFCQNNA